MFSIIICTYNGGRTLKNVINKILLQNNYDKYVKEFIIVDNASTDNTSEIIKNFKIQSDIIYSYEPKCGLANARLNGVNIATGSWIIFVDDDNELDSDWIETAAHYIESHNDIGIFGGSVIPKLEFNPTNEELQRLKKHYGMLACTDMYREDIDFSKNVSPFIGIIGAGMVIKTEYIKELVSLGWINQMGRTKDNTAAGDDSEISNFVTEKKGKKSGYCPHLIIQHNLPESRLQESYLLKLHSSISEAGYRGQSLKSFYVLRRFKWLMHILFSKNPYKKDSLEYKMKEQGDAIYIDLLKKDKFIFRG